MINSRNLLKKHEGFRYKCYPDSVGKLTIGYGRNLTDNGITEAEAEVLFENDYQDALRTSISLFPRFVSLSEVRQAVLLNMAFNLGLPRLKGFVKFFCRLGEENYLSASDEMLDSKWALQVGSRAQQLAEMMATNKWPKEENEKSKETSS